MEKTDKMIAVVCVIIIILAGIGIWQSLSSRPSGKKIELPKGYLVTWERKIGALPDIQGEALDRIISSDVPYTVNVSIDKDNLENVTFTLIWEDDHTYGLFRRKGLDKLTLVITDPDGIEICNDTTEGNATVTIKTSTNFVPTITYIEANSLEEAERKLEENYSHKWKDEPFRIYVSVKVGEPIFRPLKRLRDKGNNFTIKISYTYYEPRLVEASSHEELEEMSAPSVNETKALEMVFKMGCGRV